MRDPILRRLQQTWHLQVEIIQSKNKEKQAHVLFAVMPKDANCQDNCRDAIIAATALHQRPKQLRRHKAIKSLFDDEILPFVEERSMRFHIKFCRTGKDFTEWEDHMLGLFP